MSAAWDMGDIRTFVARARPDLRLAGARPLSGGYWNDVWRLDTDQGRMVLKHYRGVMEGTLFPNLPQDEARALAALAGLGVAPDPVGYWPEARVLLYGYVEGTPWDGDLAAMAALLMRKHAVGAEGFRAVPMDPAGILAQGDDLFAPCADAPLTRRLRALRPDAAPIPPGARSLIHTDIGAMNLIGVGEGLRLIDWQCPAAGDAAEDLYTALSPAFMILNLREPLTANRRRALLHLLADTPMARRLPLLEPAFAWRMAGYCCRRMQGADDPAVRDRYARAAGAEAEHLEALT